MKRNSRSRKTQVWKAVTAKGRQGSAVVYTKLSEGINLVNPICKVLTFPVPLSLIYKSTRVIILYNALLKHTTVKQFLTKLPETVSVPQRKQLDSLKSKG
jgi:hypothetical protein